MFAKTDSGPIETFTEHVVAWVILCLYLNIFVKACFPGPLTKCCELDVNSVSYLWRVVDSESHTLCREITLTKVSTDSQHFVRLDSCESTLTSSGNMPSCILVNQFSMEDLQFIMKYLWKLNCWIVLNQSNISLIFFIPAICIIGIICYILLDETDALEVL